MLDQEYDPELDDDWLTADDPLNFLARLERILQRGSNEQSSHMFKYPNILSNT